MPTSPEMTRMARPKGRPKSSERDDVTVKLDRALANMARMVASAKGMPLVEYLSEAARPVIEKDFVAQMKRLEGRG
jgi:hypothetical protein